MKYIGKKIVSFIATLLIVSFLVFFAFTVIPGDPATSMLGTEATPERIEEVREELGLNEPFLQRYIDWATGFVSGDMGESYSYHLPVSEMVSDKMVITGTLAGMAFIITILISIPVGIYAAKHEGGLADRIIYVLNQVTMSIPPFFFGILFTLIFGLVFRWFTPGGYVSYTKDVLGYFQYLFFPALAIALPKSAMTIKLLRSAITKETKLDYVRTAYSKGNSSKNVLYQHVLKNAMIPVITFLGMTLTDMIAGSIIIEQVFSIPGVGRILLTSISNRDYPVVMAIIVCVAFFVILVNLIVDILYQKIDPRIKQV